jgi:hypothetical protein
MSLSKNFFMLALSATLSTNLKQTPPLTPEFFLDEHFVLIIGVKTNELRGSLAEIDHFQWSVGL